MKIILDAMGGDNAPDAVVRGALEAAKEFGVQIVLVGRGADILASMKAQGWDTLPDGVELANAEDVVDMHCDPAAVVKQHPNSSLVLGARMLAQGGGDAFISAGNTGALLTAATLLVKRIRGIRRAAFSPVLPTKGVRHSHRCGRDAECTPEFLLQFGCMGSFYAQKALGIESPRVGLLNNGAEDTKGDPLHREAHQLLKRAAEQGTIHFVGNVEARDVPFGAADVIVADGFSGNVLLKTMEGTAMFMSGMMKQMFYRNPLTMLGALLCKKGINGIRKTMDYRETGGSIVIGISRPVIKAHGSSDDAAIRGAIRAVERPAEIRANIGQMILPREEEHAE
ncbi:MAG: phosphate acyltransferase PlsX [Oscillospiraceae bacterium]